MPLFDIARAVEDQFHRDVIPVLKRRGWRPRVVAYDGYGTSSDQAGGADMARVLARMVLRPVDAPTEGPLFRSLPERRPASAAEVIDNARISLADAQRGWRLFIDAPVPFLPVTITVGGARIRTRADREG